MKLSTLQKYILQTIFLSGSKKVARKVFHQFYKNQKSITKPADQINVITKSLEGLIAKNLLVGFGEVTAHKWFIKEVSLTALGKKITKQLLGQQISLPLK